MVASLCFADSSPLLHDRDALRARAAEDGYLFFRGRMPAEPLLSLRREILGVLREHGLLNPGEEDTVDPERLEGLELVGGCTDAAYADVQRLESFHTLAHHPRLLEIYETLFDGPVLPHPRNIARVLLPARTAAATPPHQDFIHIQGTPQTWTAWFPLGDCPRQLGGLSVLERSHEKGVLAVGDAEGAGGLGARLCPGEDRWIEHDYAVGDVLTFPSTTVHKGLPNRIPKKIRLSCDLRYQSALEPIEQKSLEPHRNVLSWDEVYAGWESDRFQRYWQRHELQPSAWDESIRWQKERICD